LRYALSDVPCASQRSNGPELTGAKQQTAVLRAAPSGVFAEKFRPAI
jgi:hypothetical protein